MSRLTRDGTAEPVSRDQILRHARGQGNIIFPVQLTTSRIGNLTRLIHTLLYVMTIHTYIHTCVKHTPKGIDWRQNIYYMESNTYTHTATHAADDIYNNYSRTRVRSDSYTVLINTLRSRVSRPMAMTGHVSAT